MKLILCKNGHFYDRQKGPFCPVCGAAAAEEAMNSSYDQEEKRETIQPIASSQDIPETTVLEDAGSIPETTVLEDAANIPETTVLEDASAIPETTVLEDPSAGEGTVPLPSGFDIPETSILEDNQDSVSYQSGYSDSESREPALKIDRRYCVHCFRRNTNPSKYCQFCGETMVYEPILPIQLAPGTMIGENGRYVIGLATGQGGFGIVYRAFDTKLQVVVAVKEYFPRHLVTRAPGTGRLIVTRKSMKNFEFFKNRFWAEARTLAKYGNHRNIPNVFELFEDSISGTAYIVMEYLEGISLRDYIIQNGGKVDTEFAIHITEGVCSALRSLHEDKIVHRDVAPDNIFICKGAERKIKLMDLGAARLTEMSDEGLDRVMKPGFSPPEQYDKNGDIGPWTDIYALGATLYAMLTGAKPEESTNRKITDKTPSPHMVNPAIDENLSNAVMKAMAIEPHMRFKNVDEFLEAVIGKRKVISLEKERKKRRTKRLMTAIAILALVAAAVLAGMTLFRNKKAEEGLLPADITLWFSVNENSEEEKAIKAVIDDFQAAFEGVTVSITAIPADEYADRLEKAAKQGELPTLFESTGVSETVLANAADVKSVLSSEQARNCLFLDQYTSYYDSYKQIPLAIEIPVAWVITNGPEDVQLDFKETYFTDIAQLTPANGKAIAVDSRCEEMIAANFSLSNTTGQESFLNSNYDMISSPVLLTSTMINAEVRQTLQRVEKNIVFYDARKVLCRYIYEWSVGSGNEDQLNAAKRLISWMLGEAYQNTLMITECSDGQIPLNETSFRTKCNNNRYLEPALEIYKKFTFKR